MSFSAEQFLSEFSNILTPQIILFLENVAWASRYGDGFASGLMNTGHLEKTIFHGKATSGFTIYPDSLFTGQNTVEIQTAEQLRMLCMVDVWRNLNLLPKEGKVVVAGQGFSVQQRLLEPQNKTILSPQWDVSLKFHHVSGRGETYPKFVQYSGGLDAPGHILNPRAMTVRDAHIVLGGDLPDVKIELERGLSRSNTWGLPEPYTHATQIPIAYESEKSFIPTGSLQVDGEGNIVEGSHLISMQFGKYSGVSSDLIVQMYRTNKKGVLRPTETLSLRYPKIPVHVNVSYPRRDGGDSGAISDERWKAIIAEDIAKYYEKLKEILTIEKRKASESKPQRSKK